MFIVSPAMRTCAPSSDGRWSFVRSCQATQPTTLTPRSCHAATPTVPITPPHINQTLMVSCLPLFSDLQSRCNYDSSNNSSTHQLDSNGKLSPFDFKAHIDAEKNTESSNDSSLLLKTQRLSCYLFVL